MDTDIIIVLAILISTIIMLVIEITRIDVVAIICMLTLGWTGILDNSEMLSGFSSNAVATMMAVMIMGYGITKTGIMDKFSDFVIRKYGDKKQKTVGFLSLVAGFVSGFILNIGAAALFLPGIINISRKAKIPASTLVMPVGFAILLGGTLTLIGASHLIIVNDLLSNAGLQTYSLLSVTPVGIVLLLAGIAFFYLFGKHVLPHNEGNTMKTEQEKLIEELSLPSNIWYFSISKQSPIIGLTAEKSGIWANFNVNIIGISGADDVIYAPSRETLFSEGQELALLGTEENIKAFVKHFQLVEEPPIKRFARLHDPDQSGFAEVIIRPRSEFIGKQIREMAIRRRFAVEPARLFSKGEETRGDFSDHKILPGDTIIVYGLWEKIVEMKNHIDFVVATPIDFESKDQSKMLIAVLCFLSSIAMSIAGFPLSLSFLSGAIVMVLTGVLNIQQAYKAIDWKVIFLLAGLIPLGLAMQKTGTSLLIASEIMDLVKGGHTILIMAAIGVIATLFSLFMSNVGAIVVLVPLVIGMAEIGGLDPRPLVLFAAVCVSNSFILPTQQVNALYMSPGGYKNIDFIKAGGGISILFLIIATTIFYFCYI